MNDQKSVLIIAGGEWQVPIIQKAKDMGLRVINTNLYPDSPGFEIADVGIAIDVLDKENNLDIARQYSPDAVLTDQSDIAVPTVAAICEKLRLPGIGELIAERFTNKLKMREFGKKLGIAQPKFQQCTSAAELELFFTENKGPIVVKPPASQSSRGISKVSSLEQLQPAFRKAQDFSKGGIVIAEDYIDGVEITVEGLKLPERHLTLAVSSKEHYEHNRMVAKRLLYTNEHSYFNISELTKRHDNFIEGMGLPFGITHTEYKFLNGEFFLIETAARGGGTMVSSHIIPLMSGVDANAALIKMALGEKISVPSTERGDRHVVLQFFDFEPGTVKSIRGLEEAKHMRGIVDLGLSFKAGDKISSSRDDRSRHMHIIAEAGSLSALEKLVTEAKEMIRVEYA